MAMTSEGVARIFRILGLPVPGEDRLERIANDGRSATQIRDDLLDWGKGQGDDTYRKMLTSLVEARIGDATPAEGQVESIVDQIASGEATIDEKYADIDKYIRKDETSGGGKEEPEPEDVGPPLKGGQTIQVTVDGQKRYYQVYEFPQGSGNFVSYQYNDEAQAIKALGESFDRTTRSEKWFNENVLAEGAAEEIIGRSGSWEGLTSEVMRDAAVAAGVRDPSLIGRIASNREMQELLAQSVLGDWSDAQLLAEQRKTDFWKNELYPGIENLYGRFTNPEAQWREYQRSVAPALEQLGYERDSDGTFNTQMERMLDSKIDSSTFLSQVPTFVRAQQNTQFAQTLNEWAVRDLDREIDFNDWFDLLAGESQPELNEVAERATLAWVAENQGSEVSQGQIERLAERSQLSEAEARQAFSDFNRSVLALGNQGLGKYGLTRDEVLSVEAGVDPESGRSIDEVKLLVAKTAREQGLADDEKISFYTGFDPQGRPQRPGLLSLAPEGA